MTPAEPHETPLTPFPLVAPGASDAAGLTAIVRRLSIARTLSEIMDITVHAARTLLHADGITFVLRDGDRCYYADEDAIGPLWKGHRFPIGACISGWCMTERTPAAIPDITQDPRIPQDAYRPTFVKSLVMVPVRQEDPIAALGAYWATTRDIPAADVELLQTVADAAALAVLLVELQQERNKLDAGSEPPAIPREVDGDTHGRAAGGASAPARTRPLQRLREGLLCGGVRPNSVAAHGFAVLCVGVATAARLALGELVTDGAPFATYFPAALLATLVGGAAAGTLALVLGGVVAWWAFLPPQHAFALTSTGAASLALYVLTGALIVWAAASYRRGYLGLRAEEAKRLLLTQELQHRMQNALAVVQAIVSQSLREYPERRQTIIGRIGALAASSRAVTAAEAGSADLRRIVERELQPYGSARVAIEGAPVVLDAGVAHALTLAIHELATNAAKYGSLSSPGGRLAVAWTATAGRIAIDWRESDGPPVTPPTRRGFGTGFIKRLLAAVGATMEAEFRPEGLACRIVVEADRHAAARGKEPR